MYSPAGIQVPNLSYINIYRVTELTCMWSNIVIVKHIFMILVPSVWYLIYEGDNCVSSNVWIYFLRATKNTQFM